MWAANKLAPVDMLYRVANIISLTSLKIALTRNFVFTLKSGLAKTGPAGPRDSRIISIY